MYRGTFYDNTGNLIYIDIGSGNLEGQKLVFGADPVILEYTGTKDIFSPIRTQKATINLITDGLQYLDLFTNDFNVPVKIWSSEFNYFEGWLTPNVYSQSVESNSELTLECIDFLGRLKYIPYEKKRNSKINNIIDYISDIFNLDSDTSRVFYYQNLINYNLTDYFITEDYREDDYTRQELLSDILTYFGYSIVYYNRCYYLINPQYLGKVTSFKKYIGKSYSSTDYNILSDLVYNKLSIGYGVGLEMNEYYNKFNLKGEFKNDLLDSDVFDTSKFNIRDQFSKEIELSVGNRKYHAVQVFNPNITPYYYQYINGSALRKYDPDINTLQSNSDHIGCKILRQTGGYTDTRPQKNTWQHYISTKRFESTSNIFRDIPLFDYKIQKSGIYKDIKLCISFESAISIYPTIDDSEVKRKPTNTDTFSCKFILRIGNKYYNGSGWQGTKTSFNIWTIEESEKAGHTAGTFIKNRNTNTYSNFTPDLTGYIIHLNDECLTGDLELSMYIPEFPAMYQLSGADSYIPRYVKVKDFKLSYQAINTTDITLENREKIIYSTDMTSNTNVEFDTLESNLITRSEANLNSVYWLTPTGDYDYLETIIYNGVSYIPEQHRISQYYNQYSTPTRNLSFTLLSTELLNPLRLINVGGVKYIISDQKHNLKQGESELTITERKEDISKIPVNISYE